MDELDIDINIGGVLPITVLPTSATVTVLQGAGRLAGWSLRDLSTAVPIAKRGNVTAPGAGATIATTGVLAAGTYTIQWTVELDGAPAAADENNFQLFNAAVPVIVSINPAVAGAYPQPAAQLVVAAGATVSIKAVGAGTAAVGYTADFTLTPVLVADVVAEITSGGDVLGEVSIEPGEVVTQWFGSPGLRAQGAVILNMIQGSVTGTFYVAPSRGSQ